MGKHRGTWASDRYGNPRPGAVKFSADLGNKPHIEQVSRVAHMGGREVYLLSRFGRPVVHFIASAAQARKIESGRGKLNITFGMIEKARRV